MSGASETTPQEQSLPTVAETLGVDEHEAATILAQHGYREDAEVTEITEEDYKDLMERPPLDADEPGA
jgi:ribosomal protein S13